MPCSNCDQLLQRLVLVFALDRQPVAAWRGASTRPLPPGSCCEASPEKYRRNLSGRASQGRLAFSNGTGNFGKVSCRSRTVSSSYSHLQSVRRGPRRETDVRAARPCVGFSKGLEAAKLAALDSTPCDSCCSEARSSVQLAVKVLHHVLVPVHGLSAPVDLILAAGVIFAALETIR